MTDRQKGATVLKNQLLIPVWGFIPLLIGATT